ncbi:uncharacterized protein LOC141604687 [Silene latifolia]|uniref:uncharacterized protein LOC141604687 n=1 Tax=Silene latifolia TaxID=37657 RepID=UPI003D78538F
MIMVVAAGSTTPAPILKTTSSTPGSRFPSNPRRPPLLQSEKDNSNRDSNNNGGIVAGGGGGGAQYRRPKSREVSSRYLSISSSSSTSNSSSSSSATNLSNQTPSFRRCPSPSPSRPRTPATRTGTVGGESPAIKRAVSAERRRPSTPKMSAAAKMLVSSTRSLSVSFQGESYAVPRVKSVKPVVNSGSVSTPGLGTPGLRRGTPERRNAGTPWKAGENSRPSDQPWPGRVVSMSRSVDLGSGKVVRALKESLVSGERNSNAMSIDSATLRKSRIKDDGNVASSGLESRILDRNSNEMASDLSTLRKSGIKDDGNVSGMGLEPRNLDQNLSRTSSDSCTLRKIGDKDDGDVANVGLELRNLDRTSSAASSDSGTLRKSRNKDESSVAGVGLESRGSDADSVSSGSNSGSQNGNSLSSINSSRSKGGGRSLIVAPRHWHDSKRGLEPSSPMARMTVPQKNIAPKKFVSESPVGSPRRPLSSSGNRGFSSPIRGSVRPASPNKMALDRYRPASPSKMSLDRCRPASPSKISADRCRPASPSKMSGDRYRPASPSKMTLDRYRPASPSKMALDRSSPSTVMGRMASPSRARSAVGSTPSVLSYGADVRVAKVGVNRISDAHLLRLLHNRHLQWRFVNAKAEASLSFQHFNAERSLYNAWKATSDLSRTVSSKRQELQWLRLKLKVVSILKRQILHLEEWALIDKDHCSSLSGATESLQASTIRLPLISGARVDVQDLKDAICSAADVMHSMASSICALSRKVEEMNTLAAEVANLTAKERYFLNDCKDTLSMLTGMQVKDCSLRAQILQLKCALSRLAGEV